MKEDISKELIFNYFAGRVTAFEKETIDQWASEPAGNEQFFVWLQEFESQNLQYSADIESGILRHQMRMRGLTPAPLASPAESFTRPLHSFNWLHIKRYLAAAAIVLAILSAGWALRDQVRYEVYRTGFAETKRIELSDRSRVVLNANSSLRVPRFGFGGRTREVDLTGEASFSVVHTSDHKNFIVHTGKNLDIEVLGTEFNVYARAKGTKVVLTKGKVQLHYGKGTSAKKLVMKPGDLVTVDKKGFPSLSRTENPQKFSAWKFHRFIFENTSLREICTVFEDNFGIQVLIPDSALAQETISGSFTALNAEELLEILTDDSGLSYVRSDDGKVITLSY